MIPKWLVELRKLRKIGEARGWSLTKDGDGVLLQMLRVSLEGSTVTAKDLHDSAAKLGHACGRSWMADHQLRRHMQIHEREADMINKVIAQRIKDNPFDAEPPASSI